MKNFFKLIKELFSDHSGHFSSIRVLLFLSFALLVWMFIEWRRVLHIEILRNVPDYDGVTKLFLAMMVTFGLSLLAKVMQKKQEKEDNK